jgi:hypothetical protein
MSLITFRLRPFSLPRIQSFQVSLQTVLGVTIKPKDGACLLSFDGGGLIWARNVFTPLVMHVSDPWWALRLLHEIALVFKSSSTIIDRNIDKIIPPYVMSPLVENDVGGPNVISL